MNIRKMIENGSDIMNNTERDNKIDTLLNENIELVSFVLGKYFQNESMMDIEDMFQYGCIGLYKFCADWVDGRYKDKNYKFSTMANFHIRSHITHALDHQYRKFIVDYDTVKYMYEQNDKDKNMRYNIRFYFKNLIEKNILSNIEVTYISYKLDGYSDRKVQELMGITNYDVKKIMKSLRLKIKKEDVIDLLSN